MPVYTYRREDGSMFEVRQRFLDEPLTVDPNTGQKVVRVVQVPGIIFKGSGFYVNDSKNASKSSLNGNGKSGESGGEKADAATAEASANGKAEVKADAALEKKVS